MGLNIILVGHTVGLEQSWLVQPLSHSHSPFEHTPCLLHPFGHWFLRAQAIPEYSGEQKQAKESGDNVVLFTALAVVDFILFSTIAGGRVVCPLVFLEALL